MQNNTETSRQQILPFGEAESTCSPEVFPASRFRLQANAREQRMNATCGPKCLEQFGRFVPAGSWARTFSGLLIGRKEWSSNKCALTWKLKGTKSNRLYFRLVPSALPTEGTDVGLLPTVQTQGLKQCEKGKTVFMPLGLLPTPNASEGEKYTTKYNPNSQRGRGLTAMGINGMLPTPNTTDWNTPLSPIQKERYEARKPNASALNQLRQKAADVFGTTFQLNPLFIAEMMGFPLMWTVLPFQNGATSPSKPTETL